MYDLNIPVKKVQGKNFQIRSEEAEPINVGCGGEQQLFIKGLLKRTCYY